MTVVAWTFSLRDILSVIADESTCASRFALILFSFAFVAPSFSLFAFIDVECIAASRFSISGEVTILTNDVVGEGREIALESGGILSEEG